MYIKIILNDGILKNGQILNVVIILTVYSCSKVSFTCKKELHFFTFEHLNIVILNKEC